MTADVVREGGIYKFRLSEGQVPERLEPTELFSPDPDDATMGRFTPMNHVGTIRSVVHWQDGLSASFDIEVHPSKLTDDGEYRQLLEQVADHAAEAVLQGFAPASRLVAPSEHELGELAYRSLAFIAARLRQETFQSALEQILHNPHRRWTAVIESRSIARGLPAGAGASRQLTRPGPRVPTPGDRRTQLPLPFLPEKAAHQRNEIDYDTGPNQFVRFVFEHWMNVSLEVENHLSTSPAIGQGPLRRGLDEARWVIDQCERVLRTPVLRTVSRLRRFPHGDPVLLHQSGYREVLRTFALAEASLALDADVDDDLYSATQRNIATLYEYWCFLVLVTLLNDLCGEPSTGSLFKALAGGLSLALSEGSASRVSWSTERDGRRLEIDLWFNQTFRRSDPSTEISSWASTLRPDASLRIRPQTGRPGGISDPYLDCWLHFDAKYRVDVQSSSLSELDPKLAAKRTDLLRMHAYRDLIRRSAGAYVLYPGDSAADRRSEFHEILPGIGAFPLRPGPVGTVSGVAELRSFLDETLALVANQASANERVLYWNHQHTRDAGRRIRPVDFLTSPPKDETVLLGYVRSDQWPWIIRTRSYNLRADDRKGSVRDSTAELAARLILLWTRDRSGSPQVLQLFERVGPWRAVTSQELIATGYPKRTNANAYLLAEINPVPSMIDAQVRAAGELPLPTHNEPTWSTWDQLARSS